MKHRFTLVELLVGTAIIAVLTALLLPALKSAREKARRMACMSNLRQVGIAYLSYLNDNDYALPRLWSYSSGFSGIYGADTDWWVIYGSYLDRPVNLNAAKTYSNGLRFCGPPLQCPSNYRKDSYRNAYVMCAGSAINCRAIPAVTAPTR